MSDTIEALKLLREELGTRVTVWRRGGDSDTAQTVEVVECAVAGVVNKLLEKERSSVVVEAKNPPTQHDEDILELVRAAVSHALVHDFSFAVTTACRPLGLDPAQVISAINQSAKWVGK